MYKYSFMNNAQYSAEDINKIASRLVVGGVADLFADGSAYNTTHLNDITSTVSQRGVVYDNDTSLRIVKTNNHYFVSCGTAIFGNGSTLEVTEAHEITIQSGSTNYVYLLSDMINCKNSIVVSTIAPTDDQNTIINIAQISASGVITDKRYYARGKLKGYENNFFAPKKLVITDTININAATSVLHDLQTENITFLFIKGDNCASFYSPIGPVYYSVGVDFINNVYTDRILTQYSESSASSSSIKLTLSKQSGTQWKFNYVCQSGSPLILHNLIYTMYYV